MPAKILNASQVKVAADAIKRGELVAMPTETVYGLAGSALDPDSLAKIFSTKERPTFDPLILHIANLEDLKKLVDFTKLSKKAIEIQKALTDKFWPGPLTLVFPKSSAVHDLATSGLPTVAIRMPAHPLARALIAEAQVPLAAPSANRFGRISPTSAADVLEELGDRIEFILDGGPCKVGVESTIVRIENNGELTLLRPGGLPIEELEKSAHVTLSAKGEIAAPGMLEGHYAPKKKLITLSSRPGSVSDLPTLEEKSGLLLISGDPKTFSHENLIVKSLSVSGDLIEAARNLFSTLRELDRSDAKTIFAEPCAIKTGLGYAISDRLTRAAAGSHSALTQAIEEARKWVGATSPNPPVGAAGLDRDGKILAVEAHHQAGEPHAEINVIEKCRSNGSLERLHTLIVTLEPCNHHGKTGPCTEAILKVPSIRKVVYGTGDPNPKMAGGGSFLASRGIEIQNLNDPACAELIRSFSHWIKTGRPWVVVKTARDQNGSMIPPKGHKTFASESSLKLAHQMRKRADAIITGSGTVLADRPEFTVRNVPDFPGKKRILAVFDRRNRVASEWLKGRESSFFPMIWDGSIDSLLQNLGARGALEILVEAGPTLSQAFLSSGLWDEHVVIEVGSQGSTDRVYRNYSKDRKDQGV